jgi:hypothetical protein
MKCSRCFKYLPEVEMYDWAIDDRGLIKHKHLHEHPFYTCTSCGKNYCIGCWVKKQCEDMIYEKSPYIR